jgi:hypothetical protein
VNWGFYNSVRYSWDLVRESTVKPVGKPDAEIRTSGLMSGDGKRGGAFASVLAPILDSTKTACLRTVKFGKPLPRNVWKKSANRSLAVAALLHCCAIAMTYRAARVSKRSMGWLFHTPLRARLGNLRGINAGFRATTAREQRCRYRDAQQ